MTDVSREQVMIGDTSLSFLAAGRPGSPLAVCLHGMPAGAELWRAVLPALAAAGYRAVAPDLPGYGHTRLPDQADHSLSAGATLLTRWLVDAQSGPVWLVGHDLGGVVAQSMAVARGDLFGRLTLVDSVHTDTWPVRPILLLRALARAGVLPFVGRPPLVPNPYFSWELRRGFADPATLDDDTRTRVFFDTKITDPDGRRRFARHVRTLDAGITAALGPRLRDLRMPTQVIWGVHDRFQPWAPVGEALVDLLPAPRVDQIESGHFVPVEAPALLASALLAWAGPAPAT